MLLNDHTKHVIDATAAAATIGTMINWLPAVAAIFSITWTGLRIIEMLTGKPINILVRRKKNASDQEGKED